MLKRAESPLCPYAAWSLVEPAPLDTQEQGATCMSCALPSKGEAKQEDSSLAGRVLTCTA